MNGSPLKMLAILLVTAGLSLKASPLVQVTLDATSGVSNGAYFVLPYNLSINGQNILADCYDFLDTVEVGESWTATIDTLAQAAMSGRFSVDPGALQGYELIGVLSMLPTISAQSQIDLQELMWNVFDPGNFVVTPDMASDLSIANTEIPTFDFSRVEFIEPTSGENVQAFVTITSDAPEPVSCLLIAVGLIALGALKRRVDRAVAPR